MVWLYTVFSWLRHSVVLNVLICIRHLWGLCLRACVQNWQFDWLNHCVIRSSRHFYSHFAAIIMITSQLHQLGLASLLITKSLECHFCWVAGNTLIPFGMWVPVAMWLLSKPLHPCCFTLLVVWKKVSEMLLSSGAVRPQHGCIWSVH